MLPLASPDGAGHAAWDFLCGVVCEAGEDVCQPNELPVLVQEQKGILVQAFAVMQALHRCQDEWSSKKEPSEFTGISQRQYENISQRFCHLHKCWSCGRHAGGVVSTVVVSWPSYNHKIPTIHR